MFPMNLMKGLIYRPYVVAFKQNETGVELKFLSFNADDYLPEPEVIRRPVLPLSMRRCS